MCKCSSSILARLDNDNDKSTLFIVSTPYQQLVIFRLKIGRS